MAGAINKLQAITAFVRCVDEGGFSAAAARLGITASSVTKVISRLESDIGARLFNRTTRRIRLTECGEIYYHHCLRVLTELEEAETTLREVNSSAEGQVRVVMPYSFGRDTLIPALGEFYQRYPSISLDINFKGSAVDLIKEGFDLAVRTGELPDSGLIRRVLLNTPMVTVAAPEYLERCGTPTIPEDLANHNCIIGRRVSSEWCFQQGRKKIAISVAGNLRVDNGDALRAAAAAGLGIAHSTSWLFRNDLEAGNVVPILEDFNRDQVPVSVLYSAKRHLPAKVKTVIDFLIEVTGGHADHAANDASIHNLPSASGRGL